MSDFARAVQSHRPLRGNQVSAPVVCRCRNSIQAYFLNLSPVNAKLTSLSYVHASTSLEYLSLRQGSPLPSTIATATCVFVILPINRQISVSLLIQFASNFEIVKIMLVNNRKLNSVRLCAE